MTIVVPVSLGADLVGLHDVRMGSLLRSRASSTNIATKVSSSASSGLRTFSACSLLKPPGPCAAAR